MEINKEYLKGYLEKVFEGDVSEIEINKLGEGCVGTGYSLDFKLNGETKRKILKTLFTSNLGMDHFSDRAGSLLLAHSHYSKISQHISSFDVCGITEKGKIISVGDSKEFFILMDEAHGQDMFKDFEQIAKKNVLSDNDRDRIVKLSNFLVELHKDKPTENEDSLYKRNLRSVIGGNTSVMSIIDMYPQDLAWISEEDINNLIKKSVDFWTNHRFKKSRLCHVHGDFHPGNIWFKENNEFTILDRSGQTYGEAADDLTAFSINFIFYSLKEKGEFSRAPKEGFNLFWDNYLEKTQDSEIKNIAPLFFALRSMVVANPIFYNDEFFGSKEKANNVRRKMFEFSLNLFKEKTFSF